MATLGACNKDNGAGISVIPTEDSDIWVSTERMDAAGNHYYVAYTAFHTLELRIRDRQGEEIISHTCGVEPSEIPAYASNVFLNLVVPNRFIGADDATLSIALYSDEAELRPQYVQLLLNINVQTKKIYSKKYTITSPADFAYKASEGALVQWYQNTLLVKEGRDVELNAHGGMLGENGPGSVLVCYERDFTERYRLPIDAGQSYLPIARDNYIPLNDFEAIYFRGDGLISRERMVLSASEEARGKRPVVWQIDLRRHSKMPVDYTVKLNHYDLRNGIVETQYAIFDKTGRFVKMLQKNWNVENGYPQP
ncbi:hypothetical protein BWD42_07525 [Sphingobacterium sp. CZ-UAM]|nr:hypothetical protein BWD42_07525 [Sphingobacterium sp. CZ-UAM]